MKFKRAFKLMQSGAKIKLPNWGTGYLERVDIGIGMMKKQ